MSRNQGAVLESFGQIASIQGIMEKGNGLGTGGEIFRIGGVALCIASIYFGLLAKTEDVFLNLFFVSMAILVSVSVFYFIARRLSERWRSKDVRACFSPYIIGATIWIVMTLFLFILNRSQ